MVYETIIKAKNEVKMPHQIIHSGKGSTGEGQSKEVINPDFKAGPATLKVTAYEGENESAPEIGTDEIVIWLEEGDGKKTPVSVTSPTPGTPPPLDTTATITAIQIVPQSVSLTPQTNFWDGAQWVQTTDTTFKKGTKIKLEIARASLPQNYMRKKIEVLPMQSNFSSNFSYLGYIVSFTITDDVIVIIELFPPVHLTKVIEPPDAGDFQVLIPDNRDEDATVWMPITNNEIPMNKDLYFQVLRTNKAEYIFDKFEFSHEPHDSMYYPRKHGKISWLRTGLHSENFFNGVYISDLTVTAHFIKRHPTTITLTYCKNIYGTLIIKKYDPQNNNWEEIVNNNKNLDPQDITLEKNSIVTIQVIPDNNHKYGIIHFIESHPQDITPINGDISHIKCTLTTNTALFITYRKFGTPSGYIEKMELIEEGVNNNPLWRIMGYTQGNGTKGPEGKNEDSLGGYSCKDGYGPPIIAVVADGISSVSRPQIGSRLAVQAAIEVLRGLIEKNKDEIDILKDKLPTMIYDSWYQKAKADFDSNPITTFKDIDRIYRIYATTLLCVMVTDKFIIYLQVGDGEISMFFDENDIQQIKPASNTNMTYIISDITDYSIRVDNTTKLPRFITLNSDFHKFNPLIEDYHELMMNTKSDEDMKDYIINNINEDKDRKGDDSTLCVIWNLKQPVVPTPTVTPPPTPAAADPINQFNVLAAQAKQMLESDEFKNLLKTLSSKKMP